MTPEELHAIRARAAAATPGPWKVYNAWGPEEYTGRYAAVRVGTDSERTGIHAAGGADLYATKADFEFVAHARTDIPALLGALASAEAAREKAEQYAAKRHERHRMTDADLAEMTVARDDWQRATDGQRKLVFELAARVADLERQVAAAVEFVEMAAYADNSGREYLPECQECNGKVGRHTSACRLNAWLIGAAALLSERGT